MHYAWLGTHSFFTTFTVSKMFNEKNISHCFKSLQLGTPDDAVYLGFKQFMSNEWIYKS